MTAKIFIPSDSMWANAIKSMVESGDITVEQGNRCLERLKTQRTE